MPSEELIFWKFLFGFEWLDIMIHTTGSLPSAKHLCLDAANLYNKESIHMLLAQHFRPRTLSLKEKLDAMNHGLVTPVARVAVRVLFRLGEERDFNDLCWKYTFL